MNFIFFLIQILGYFLPKRIAELVSHGIARFCYYFIYKKSRENHLSNLKVAFGDEISDTELKKITKKAIYNLAVALYEHTIMGRLNKRNYTKYLKGEMMENLFNAHREGNGVIILSAHTGNYEWGAALMSLTGFSVSSMSLEYRSEYIKNIYEINRKKVGINVFYVRKSFAGPTRFLKDGGVLAIACDRNFDEVPVSVKLFNRETEIPKGAFFLASRLNIPLVPAFSLKEKDGLYHVYFEKGYKITKDEIESGANKYASILAKYIKKYPEQWYVFDRIWKES